MADGTHIEWTGATWNPITGCMVKSPGCLRCYAMTLAATRLKHHPSRIGLTREVNGHHVWTGEVRLNEQWLDQPIRWTRPRDIFVVAHGDLAYEKVPDEWLDRIFAMMVLARRHRFRVLTKRPDRLLAYLRQSAGRVATQAAQPNDDHPRDSIGSIAQEAFRWPLSNVWIGTSVERQQEADERRPHLEALACMGWNTWVSYEPALGPVNWSGWQFIKWMVSGGESGPGSRSSHPDWHCDTRDFCDANGVPYFFKQWGDWHPTNAAMAHPEISPMAMVRVGKARAGALLDGIEHKAMPA